MKKYLFLLFFFIIFLCPNAFAYTYDVTNDITSPRGGASTGGRYLALEIYNTGSQNVYSVNTRYNGTLSNIEFNLPLPAAADECFTTNMEYTITMEMATSDWRNHFARPYVGADSSSTNWATSNITFVSQKKIYFKFKIPAEESLCYGFVYVRLNSTSVSSTAFTGVTNWNLSKVSLSDQYSSSGGGSSGGSSTPPTPTPNPNQNIIDNSNENTNNIIENNNQNTQQIIDNQNELLGNTCSNLFDSLMPTTTYCGITATKNNDGTYTFNGTANCNADFRLNQSTRNGVDNLITLDSGSYVLSTGSPIPNNISWVVMQNNTWDILANQSGNTSSVNFTLNSSTSNIFIYFYVRNGTTLNNYVVKPILVKGTSIIPYCKKGTTSSKLDDTNNAINNVNDSINNDNVDSGVGSDFFEDFEDNDFGLSSIITIPLNTIQSLTSKSCVALNVPIPFTNSTVPLPCMTEVYQQNVPTIYNLWKIVSFGIIAYFIAIDIFHMVKGFKDPESDKVEVLDL